MKQVLGLLLLLPFVAAAQSEQLQKDEKGNVYFSEVFEVPGKSVDEILLKVKIHVAEQYNDFGAVMQLQDEAKGLFIGRGVEYFSYKATITITSRLGYTFKIEVKPGKFRIKYFQFMIGDGSQMVPINPLVFSDNPPKMTADLKKVIIETAKNNMNDMYQAVMAADEEW